MLKKVGIVLGILVVIIGVLAVIAPKETHIESSVVVNKPNDWVFSMLLPLRSQEDWSPWAKRDPNMQKSYKGEDGKVGFVSAWSGNKEVGVGEQEITNIVPGERIDYALRFKKPMKGEATCYITTTAINENQTKVVWGFNSENHFPGTVFCLVFNMKKRLQADFDEGTQNLKRLYDK